MKSVFLAAIAAILPTSFAQAGQTSFRTRQIIVSGSGNFQAYALNDNDVIVGTLYDETKGAQQGIVLKGKTVTLLPSPNSAFDVPKPQAINNQNEILAWARNTGDGLVSMFLFKDGAYVPSYQTTLEAPFSDNGSSLPNAFGFGNPKQVFFTSIVSFSDPTDGSYGVPPKFHHSPKYNRYNTIHSMNQSGVVAGVSYTLGGSDVVFTGRLADFNVLTPPGAIVTKGGYINDLGAVAGSYADGSNVQHGFVYQSGKYVTFDMPEASSSIAVTGINNTGRVVGTYVGANDNLMHAFLYNGTKAFSFGTYGQYGSASVSINEAGAMLVWHQVSSRKSRFESFRVTCAGSGC